jgi:hypothetical protein
LKTRGRRLLDIVGIVLLLAVAGGVVYIALHQSEPDTGPRPLALPTDSACVDWPVANPILATTLPTGKELWSAIAADDRTTVLAAGRSQELMFQDLEGAIRNAPLVTSQLLRYRAALGAVLDLYERKADRPSLQRALHKLGLAARKATYAINHRMVGLPQCP